LSTCCRPGPLPRSRRGQDHGIPNPGGPLCNLTISGRPFRSEGRVHICSDPFSRRRLSATQSSPASRSPCLRSSPPALGPLRTIETGIVSASAIERGADSICRRIRRPGPLRRSLSRRRQVSIPAPKATLDSIGRHIVSFGTVQKNLVRFIEIATWPWASAAGLTARSRCRHHLRSHRRRRSRPGTRARAR
jgi:hypothetical protein